MSLHVPEEFRVTRGALGSTPEYGNNGLFIVHLKQAGGRPALYLNVIVSDGDGWDHVSVSLPHRCPTWDEMCQIKDLCWDPEDCVIQYHPPRSAYVNNHPYCLHLWRNQTVDIIRPPAIMVGVQFGLTSLGLKS